MASNDTPNILSAPLGTAGGGTIPANKVTYDGTGTSIVATNVQGAITELDTDLQSTKGDVSDLKTDLRNNSVFVEIHSVEVTGDGVKTYGELLVELAGVINTYLATLDDDMFASLKWFGGAYSAIPLAPVIYDNAHSFTSTSFIGLTYTDSWQKQVLHSIRMATTAEECHWLRSTLGSAAQTFSANALTEVLASPLKLNVTFEIYKKV